MKSLSKQIDELEGYIKFKDLKKEKVSRSTVGWQLDHTLQVINKIPKALIKSNPEEYRYSFNFLRAFLFSLGFFPRGKGKSPKVVMPQGDISKEELLNQITAAKEKLEQMNLLPQKAYFEHPYFGQLNKKRSERFLKIHTEHHLKIIREIILD